MCFQLYHYGQFIKSRYFILYHYGQFIYPFGSSYVIMASSSYHVFSVKFRVPVHLSRCPVHLIICFLTFFLSKQHTSKAIGYLPLDLWRNSQWHLLIIQKNELLNWNSNWWPWIYRPCHNQKSNFSFSYQVFKYFIKSILLLAFHHHVSLK